MKSIFKIVAVVIALVLLACGVFMGFDRGVDVGYANVITVQINEKFDAEDVEAIMKEAGATGCLVQKTQTYLEYMGEYKSGEVAIISFEVEDDSLVKSVYEKAEKLLGEKYFLKYPGELSTFTATYNRAKLFSMWPALIVIVVMLAYVFIRFGVKFGFDAIINMFVAGAATLGLVGILGIKFTGYTIPALLIACALAYGFTVIYAMLLKENSVRIATKEEALSVSAKQIKMYAAVLCAIAAIAFAIMLILGGVMLRTFALTSLIGIVINAAVAIFVLPGMASSSEKA